MFADKLGPELDGVMLATPHTTHYGIGQVLLDEAKRRIDAGEKPLHILMEKPVTANVEEAKELHEVSRNCSTFFLCGCD
jgi:predicted dehydrogenase